MTRHRTAAGHNQAQTGADLAELRGRVVFALVLLTGTFLVGVVGYHLLAPESRWIDAVYMTTNVLTTSGFREAINTENAPGREIFTILLLVFGAGTVVYFTSVMTAFVVEGDLTQSFRRRRMTRAVEEMSDHYIVCGAGNAGRAVLVELTATKRPTVAIEADLGRAQRAEHDFPMVPVLVGDSTNDELLMQAGVARARGIVICLDDDRDSLVATVTARQLNAQARIVARATDDKGRARIKAAGADAVIAPSQIGGMRMASEMVRPSVVGFLDAMLRDRQHSLRIEEVEIPEGSALAGRRVGDIDFRSHANLLLLAIHEPRGGSYVYNPRADYEVIGGSQMIVMGDPVGVQGMRQQAAVGA
jgi:voltage-gated potassium channel